MFGFYTYNLKHLVYLSVQPPLVFHSRNVIVGSISDLFCKGVISKEFFFFLGTFWMFLTCTYMFEAYFHVKISRTLGLLHYLLRLCLLICKWLYRFPDCKSSCKLKETLELHWKSVWACLLDSFLVHAAWILRFVYIFREFALPFLVKCLYNTYS